MDLPQIELTRFILMLSDALELAAPGMALHQTKTAFIALRIAQSLNLPRTRKRDLVYAALLHDIGALSPEEKIELHSPNPALIASHCRNGEIVLSRVAIFERAARLVGAHHSDWKDTGKAGGDEAFDANIIALADVAELSTNRNSYILKQREKIAARIAAGRGSNFCPELVDAFTEAGRGEEFWLELASPRLTYDFAGEERFVEYYASIGEFAEISALVRDIIDFRSTFTATHSSGVAAAASMMGSLIGYSTKENLALAIAGNLHDIGKMAIPNAILLKPSALDPDENALMHQHPFQTKVVLSRSGLPNFIIEWASYHHERLDGEGYPFALSETDIGLGARILSVADVLTALAEDRPYRNALSRANVMTTMRAEASGGHLEPGLVDLVAGSYVKIEEAMVDAQRDAAEFYATRLKAS
ncbi:MAG: HD domain-containing protein [Spirochaetaceae bacterium]|nr:HD domain-containing protein [Spirochaetaceae bacterium]